MKENNKMIIAMSGGLDSSMTAKLMLEAGFEITGIFMRLNDNYEDAERAAREVCRNLGINFYPLDLSDRFKSEVVDYFIDTYAGGQTPNPCVKCNLKIKFGELIKLADRMGAYWLATGHYVKIVKKADFYHVFRSEDKNKDQTYFLYNLNQDILKRLKFPVSLYKKEDLRKKAKEIGLPHLKKESQDACFLFKNGKILDHKEYLAKHIQPKEGDIKLLSGKVIGTHRGLPFYTIGQRRGIEIGGTGPYYAVRMDYESNSLLVTSDPDDKALYSDSLTARKVNWILGKKPKLPLTCDAVIRYRQKPVKAVIREEHNDEYLVEFVNPQRAIAPGQSAVFYKDDELLGGGIIG